MTLITMMMAYVFRNFTTVFYMHYHQQLVHADVGMQNMMFSGDFYLWPMKADKLDK